MIAEYVNEGPVDTEPAWDAYIDCTPGYWEQDYEHLPYEDYDASPVPAWPMVVVPLVVGYLLVRWFFG